MNDMSGRRQKTGDVERGPEKGTVDVANACKQIETYT
jgi:hypothetical protein